MDLKKNGKGYFGLCPFHDDTNPSLSVNPSTNLWQCFGCGAGGDVIRFVKLFDNVPFPDAVNKLNAESPRLKSNSISQRVKPANGNTGLTVKDRKLLSRVVSYYQHTFTQDSRGINYLKNDRGITDNQSLKDFAVGYVNGTLLEILPEDPDVIKALRRIGILNGKGHEIFYNCVVFPLYSNRGSIVNLYGRNIEDDPASSRPGRDYAATSVTHLYLPGRRTGLVNRQAVKRSQSIILAESIIDALTLYDQGFKNVVPIYGVNGLLDEHLSLFNRKVKSAYLVFDADDAGHKATEAVSLRLKEKGIMAYSVTLPVKDVNIYFKRHTPEEFEQLLTKANPGSIEQSDNVSKREQRLYQKTDHGFIVGYGDRQYEVKGIQRADTQLKVTIKASADVAGLLPFELCTIDLYSSRSRIWFAKLCADLFGAAEELVKEDIGKILNHTESWQPKRQQAAVNAPSKAEKAEALRFLKKPDMFNEILSDLETIGVTGEQTNKLVGYLAAVSRKLDEPLSVLIQSRSAAGKSTLQDAILSMVPEEDYVKYTRITDQALFYKDEDSLVHKILAIEEELGMGGAAYSIRNIQSSKKITVAATGKDPGTGKMKTEEYTVNGPVAVMITTTAPELEGETASRFLFLTIDESTQMTEAIHRMQREAETLDGLIRKKKGEHIIKKHHTVQRLLKPLAVVNPFTEYLSYPNRSLRTRRDHKKYLGLIRTVAYLHQYQRKIKTVQVEGKPVQYIEVTLADIDCANKLANEVLGQCLDELAPPSRTLLSGIYNMVKEISDKQKSSIDEVYFTRRMIREYTGWSDWQIKAHIKQLEEMEYLHVRVGARGKEYAYALNYRGQGEDGGKCYLNLTPVEEIKKLMKKDQGPDK
ncbi:DNA primase, phage associated [Olavius sp. associated proteobacterium Delta 1]|nr:DNA primase, phage associated [Olavius sp. associated proteobacterium Delta 1]